MNVVHRTAQIDDRQGRVNLFDLRAVRSSVTREMQRLNLEESLHAMICAEGLELAGYHQIAGGVGRQREQVPQIDGILGGQRVQRRDRRGGLLPSGYRRVSIGYGHRSWLL